MFFTPSWRLFPNRSAHIPLVVTDNDVRVVARRLWEEADRPSGHDLHFWFQAREELEINVGIISHSRIAKLAHDLWVRRGRRSDDRLQNWLEAERELTWMYQAAA